MHYLLIHCIISWFITFCVYLFILWFIHRLKYSIDDTLFTYLFTYVIYDCVSSFIYSLLRSIVLKAMHIYDRRFTVWIYVRYVYYALVHFQLEREHHDMTPLMLACVKGAQSGQVVTTLLELGADVNHGLLPFKTPLAACMEGYGTPGERREAMLCKANDVLTMISIRRDRWMFNS